MTEVRRLAPYAEGATTTTPIDQLRRAERAVAVARAFVAIGALTAIALSTVSPVSPDTRRIVSALLAGYVAFSCAVIPLLGSILERWRSAAMVLHVVDVSVAGVVTLLAGGSDGPFFVLYFFTLLAAAYRWGFVETLTTMCAALVLQFFHPDGLIL